MLGKIVLAVVALCAIPLVVLWAVGWFPLQARPNTQPAEVVPVPEGAQKATFGGGCFWCTEAVFQKLKGVTSVVSGYSGGEVKNPTYEDICTGLSGHAEVIQVTFDPKVITFTDLLEVFWQSHDPTTLNRQGADVGTQYRSVIFYHDDEQRRLAQDYKAKLNAAGAFDGPIVTEISALGTFYPAEQYHQNYYVANPNKGYCFAVIRPKMEKLKMVFKDRLKDSE